MKTNYSHLNCQDVLSKKFEKEKDIKDKEKKLEKKCKTLLNLQEKTYQNIIVMETDIIQGRKDQKITKGILKSLNNELENLKEELKKNELELSDLSEEKVWLDWIQKYGNFLETKISEQNENKKEWINGLLKT